MGEFIKSKHFKDPYAQTDIMGILKVDRDWLHWEYDSYYYDHKDIIGSKPMSFDNFKFYFEARLLRKQHVVDHNAMGAIYELIKN